MSMAEIVELLFFDTFAHDNTEEINLDLVQFPKPVYVTEVRIIPLGARVQADFPGGVRLGATNPSQFQIEFFVNDLGKPGASTFESLGGFEYNQNGCINLECYTESTTRKIPTDGLVLKGWYTTITLAVYGTLTNNITEQLIQPVVNPTINPNQPNTIADAQQIIPTNNIENEWVQQENITAVPIEYNQTTQPYQQNYPQTAENYTQEYTDYYNEAPKDPRSYHHTPETDWESKNRSRPEEKDRERDRTRDLNSIEREHRSDPERRERDRDREKNYTSHSHEREKSRGYNRDCDDYHEYYERDRERRDRDRDRDRKRDDSYRRPYRDDREDRKRPRTPPQSPKRPHTPPPQGERKESSPPEIDNFSEEEVEKQKKEEIVKAKSPEVNKSATPPVEETTQIDLEEFEPILSDEDILDDNEHYPDLDYDYSAYTNNDDLIKLFVPGQTPLKKYEKDSLFLIDFEKNSIEVEENLKTTIGIVDDYFKSSITKYTLEVFKNLNTEIKEEFIHLCEKLTGMFGSNEQFCDIVDSFLKIEDLDLSKFSDSEKEIINQVIFCIKTFIDWLKIALDYEMANAQDQPAYKLRHIKCGVRLVEWCCRSVNFIKLLWKNNVNIQTILLSLYDQEFMAISIKLMILKALDTYLLNKYSIERFLMGENYETCQENGFSVSKINGYTILLEYIRKTSSVRLKFALNSILKKINLFEIFTKFQNALVNIKNSIKKEEVTKDINFIAKALEQFLNTCQIDQFVFSHPKRFLPVSSQFEILRDDERNIMVIFFEMFNILQCFLLLLTCPSTLNLPVIKTPIFEIISELLKSPEGLNYLSNNCEIVNALLKCMLHNEENGQYSRHDYIHNLGLEMAYKVQAFYHIEKLFSIGKAFDMDSGEVLDELHGLYSLTFSHLGKISCVEVLAMKNNANAILQFLEITDKSENNLQKIKKSPAVAYAVDLLYFLVVCNKNIGFLESHSKEIFQIIHQMEYYEDCLNRKLNEINNYLQPLENLTLVYDNISTFVEIISKLTDAVTLFPGQLITSLRVIHHLGITNNSNNTPILNENPLVNYSELKYKHVILQLFSLDGMSILTKLLQKICDYYEQPNLHTSTFVSNQGFLLLSIIQPSINLLKQMLTYVIQCRNTDFKDLTAIPILLRTYNLLNTFPNTSNYYIIAKNCCRNIVDTLLVYTQPISDIIQEKDSPNKTLWSLMIGEVIKYIITAPYTFISGLLTFSELLPLPLPIQSKLTMTKDEISWIVNLRKLWSAHLHPHSNNIQELISRLCTTSHQQLLNLLRRVCVQLADLAANSATMIAKGILDPIYDALVPFNEDTKVTMCNSHIGRLLNFLACLVTHSTIKCAILQLIHSNEKYSTLIATFTQILKISNKTNSHIQAQECILSIIQSFCDIEITLLQNPVEKLELTSDVYLANALPTKEHLLLFISTMIEHLLAENTFVTCLPVVRTFLLLTEHDYGFYHLRENLLKKNNFFTTILNKLVKNFSKDNAECLSTLNTLVEFLRVTVYAVEVEGNLPYTPRNMKFSLNEIKTLTGWKVEKNDDEEVHPLVVLEEILKKITSEDIAFESLLENVSAVIKLLNTDSPETTKEPYNEPNLPEPENLLIQFSGRTVSTSTDACDERLTIRYWLYAPTQEVEGDVENVTCDISEIIRQNLPADFNMIKIIEKLCRIIPSETNDEKEKLDDQKIKIKKPFITPMRARGFPRTIQQRSDLFRSRPPNTSRPPSLHVDDFVALETCGAQPTGPTGYNKFSRELLASTRIARSTRGRAFVTSERTVQCRQMSWWGAGFERGPYQ